MQYSWSSGNNLWIDGTKLNFIINGEWYSIEGINKGQVTSLDKGSMWIGGNHIYYVDNEGTLRLLQTEDSGIDIQTINQMWLEADNLLRFSDIEGNVLDIRHMDIEGDYQDHYDSGGHNDDGAHQNNPHLDSTPHTDIQHKDHQDDVQYSDTHSDLQDYQHTNNIHQDRNQYSLQGFSHDQTNQDHYDKPKFHTDISYVDVNSATTEDTYSDQILTDQPTTHSDNGLDISYSYTSPYIQRKEIMNLTAETDVSSQSLHIDRHIDNHSDHTNLAIGSETLISNVSNGTTYTLYRISNSFYKSRTIFNSHDDGSTHTDGSDHVDTVTTHDDGSINNTYSLIGTYLPYTDNSQWYQQTSQIQSETLPHTNHSDHTNTGYDQDTEITGTNNYRIFFNTHSDGTRTLNVATLADPHYDNFTIDNYYANHVDVSNVVDTNVSKSVKHVTIDYTGISESNGTVYGTGDRSYYTHNDYTSINYSYDTTSFNEYLFGDHTTNLTEINDGIISTTVAQKGYGDAQHVNLQYTDNQTQHTNDIYQSTYSNHTDTSPQHTNHSDREQYSHDNHMDMQQFSISTHSNDSGYTHDDQTTHSNINGENQESNNTQQTYDYVDTNHVNLQYANGSHPQKSYSQNNYFENHGDHIDQNHPHLDIDNQHSDRSQVDASLEIHPHYNVSKTQVTHDNNLEKKHYDYPKIN